MCLSVCLYMYIYNIYKASCNYFPLKFQRTSYQLFVQVNKAVQYTTYCGQCTNGKLTVVAVR